MLYGGDEAFPIGGSKVLRSNKADSVAVVTAGITLWEALGAYEELKGHGTFIRIIDCYSIKPIDSGTLWEAADQTSAIITVEDHYAEGGLGEAVRSALSANPVPVYSLAVRKMPKSGKPDELLGYEEISKNAIVQKVRESGRTILTETESKELLACYGIPTARTMEAHSEEEAVSKTLEYAYDDWAMAHLARAAGATEEYRQLLDRSRNYKNVFDPSGQFMRGRFSDGTWASPFDPRGMGHSKKWRDFTESNSWQATFLNQHDVHEYMKLFGGEKGFVQKLDELFDQSSDLPADAPPDIAGMVGQYAHGNEPGHHVAYLYPYAGAAHKTQARARFLLETMHHNAPDGLAGNEDCGQMSAWYILSALGFYPVDPVSGNYVFGSPLFDRATVALGNGKHLVIETVGNSEKTPYIQSVTWNGKPYSKSWFRHADIIEGGTLVIHMGERPNEQFGARMEDRPPSFA